MKTYREEARWREYQDFFPERMRLTEETTPTEERWRWRGLDVHLDRSRPERPRARVIVLHGAGAYGRIMAPVGVIARRHGFEVVAPDLPGYGLTAVPWARMDYPLWIACVSDLVDAEAERDPLPTFLFGVSLGGMLAWQVASRRSDLAGLVVTTLAEPRETEVRGDFSRYAWLGGAGLALLSATAPVSDPLPLPMAWVSRMDGISNDPALSALCAGDPLGGGNVVPAGFLRTFLETPPGCEPERFHGCPVLLVHPGADRMTDIAHSRRFFDRLACDKRMVVLEGTSHMPTEPAGLAVLEREVVGFLERRLEERRIA